MYVLAGMHDVGLVAMVTRIMVTSLQRLVARLHLTTCMVEMTAVKFVIAVRNLVI